MAAYSLNQQAVAHARRLIEARQYVLEVIGGNVQPRAAEQNAFLAHAAPPLPAAGPWRRR